MDWKIGLVIFLFALTSCTTLQKSEDASKSWDHKYIADPHSLSFQSDIFKFQLEPSVKKLNSGFREELTDRTKYHNGEAAELEISLRIPKQDFAGFPKSITLFQWHESLKEGSKRPPVSMKLRGQELLIFAWNDELFAKGSMDSDGDIVARIPWIADQWYRIRLRTEFSPTSGRLKIEGGETRDFNALSVIPLKVLFDQKINLGYREALSYYFKFGPYTALPFQSPVTIEYAVPGLPKAVR